MTYSGSIKHYKHAVIKLPTIIRTVLLCLMALACPVAVAYAAPSLQFSPTNATVVQNNTVQLTVTINADTNSVMGADMVINYAANDLTVTSITNGGFFPQFTSNIATAGKIEFKGFVGPNDSRTGNGTLAVITLKGLQGSGSSSLSFDCSNTDIVNTSDQNILTCSTQTNTVGLSYTTTNPTSSPTPTPTLIPGATATPTPTNTPGSINRIPTCQSLSANITSMVGPQPVTFTCTGNDPDGYINGAQFSFGDGTTQVITQNVGSPGSISTTHSYTTIGSLGVSCLVQDNAGAWSNATSACQTIITINPTPSPTPYSRSSVVLAANLATPTPEVVALVSETPPVTPSASETPTIAPPQSSGSGSTWWVLGGIAAIIVGFFLLRKKGKPPVKPPAPPAQTNTTPSGSLTPGETIHLET